MTRQKTVYEKEAERLVTFAQYEFDLYKLQYPNRTSMVPTLEKSPNWHTSTEWLDGDFGLDDPVARKLISQAVASSPKNIGRVEAYFGGTIWDAQGNLKDNILDTLLSRNNITATANVGRQAAGAAIAQARIDKILNEAVKKMNVNSNMSIYMGKNGLRVGIRNLKIDVIMPMFEKGIKTFCNGSMASAAVKDMKDLNSLALMSSKMRFFNGYKGNAVLTFGPTMAWDLVDNVKKDVYGAWHFDGQGFNRAELKNQSGNAASFGIGTVASAIAVGIFGLAGAPVILIGFGVGVAVTLIWNANHMPDKVLEDSDRYYDEIRKRAESGDITVGS